MVTTLDDYMNGKVSNSSRNSVPTLNDYMNNGVAQSNSVTPRVTSQPKSPSAVSAPVNRNVTIGEGLGNLGTAIGQGAGEFFQTVANDPISFAKDTANSLIVQPAKEIFNQNAVNPDVTKSPWAAMAGGVAKGAIALPQNLWNVGVDAVNAYNNTPDQNQYKAHYVEDIANALQNNKLYQDVYQKPKQTNQMIAELSSFAAPMAIAGKISKTADAINKANKVAKESTRIASKLSDAQKAKYANQIKKLAQNNVVNGTTGATNNIVGNVATGFGLGTLEGNTLQDRIANGTGMAALGLGLTGGHALAQKAWNSKRGTELRKNSAETLKNLTTDYDKVSQAVAGIDNALNTNLSKSASDLTKTRKEYLDKLSENQNYKRHISDEERALLEDAGKLTDEQQTEIFERNKYGNRERALRISKEVKAELAKEKQEVEAPKEKESNTEQGQTEQVKQEPETAVKTQEEADKWFKDREEFAKKLEESKKAWEEQQESSSSVGDLSHIKSETDINTPKDIKTPQNEPSIQPQNENENYDFSSAKGQSLKYGVKSSIEHPNAKIDESKVTRIEGGTAEGANSGNWYEQRANAKPKRLGNENMYEIQEVEGTKPTTDAELIQEIEAAKKQKDVPVVRSKVNTKQRTPAQRMFDRRHNEIKQKAWYRKLKNTKVKALNDDTKTKSMLDIIYEDVNKGNSKDFSSLENIEHITSNEAKEISSFLNDNNVDISKFANKKVALKNLVDYFKTVKSDFINSLKDKHGDLEFNLIKGDKHARGEIHFFENSKDDHVDINVNNANEHTVLHEVGHKAAVDEIRKNNNELKEYSKASEYSSLYTEHYNTYEQEINRVGEYIKNNNINPRTQLEKLRNEYSGDKEDVNKFIRQLKLSDAYLNSVAEVHADLFAEGLIKDGEYVSVYKPAYNKAKNIFNELIKKGVIDGSPREFKELVREELRTNNSAKQGNQNNGSASSKMQGDVRGTGEERSDLKFSKLRIIKTLDWFDKTENKHTKFYHQFLEAAPEIKRFTDAYKVIQDKREAFFREFGTYTDERMKARLFKQSKSGEGVYFQQGTKRNEKVVWGEGSNTKVGFTVHKELEGISEKGTTQEGLARGFSDIVRMEHTRNCINFLKENFSKEQEGYIPVNSKLLANAMYFGKSKAWYETIRKGQEAIEKTFDEKNAKEWNELYRTTEADKSDIYLPKDLFDLSITGEKELPLDYLATYGKIRGTSGRVKGMAKVAGAMLDFYTDRFKRKVLTSASFFANNRFGNQIMLAMNSDNPAEYIKGIANAFRLKESEVPTQILESTLAEAIQHEANTGIRKYFSEKNNNLDNFARVLDGDYSELSNLSGGKKLTFQAFNAFISAPNRLFRSLSKLTGEINERFERFERKQAYAQSLSKMQKNKVLKTAKKFAGIHELAEVAKTDTLIREAVIDKVADVLGDYNNFNKFEKNFMKKLIPFYAWNRTITRHVINLAKDNPVKATLVAIETYRLLNQDDGLEDYQHGSLKTRWKNKRTNSNVVINKASMIPYNTLFDMISGENIGSVSPLITKPLEAARGEKFFKPASEITNKNWKRTIKDKKQGYQNIKTGEFREGKAPASVKSGYLAKDAMETIYPMAGSPMTKGLPDAVKHYNQTGEFLFPDKQYDANLGGFYDGDKAGKYKRGKKTHYRKLSAKNRLDLKYQLMNRTLGLGIQPEHKVSKEQKEKYKNQRKRMRGY